MPTSIAMHNRKGGVGKTTGSVCLGGALVERGNQVVIIDLDPQRDASKWLGADHPYTTTIDRVLAGQAPIKSSLEPTGVDGLEGVKVPPKIRHESNRNRPRRRGARHICACATSVGLII